MSPFLRLSRPALVGMAEALAAGKLILPATSLSISTYVPTSELVIVVWELNRLHQQGMLPWQLAYMLKVLAEERAAAQTKHDQVSLVWTGPEALGSESRDTAVVVHELFSSAQHSVLVASFAIDRDTKGHNLFRPLAQRMDANPNLQVRMFLNVKREYQDRTPATVLLRQFAETFRQRVWPGQRLPEVFHDPRTMLMTAESNACLHAKCVVVDEERLLITSANFTEAAHQRNIEAGVLLYSPSTARAVCTQFETLVSCNRLRRVPGL